MKNRKVYFAKPDQTYAEHVYSVYDAWKQIVNYKKHLIKGIANEIGFKVEEFLKLSLLTILLHDLGKLIPPFQAIMDAKGSIEMLIIKIITGMKYAPYLFFYFRKIIL